MEVNPRLYSKVACNVTDILKCWTSFLQFIGVKVHYQSFEVIIMVTNVIAHVAGFHSLTSQTY